MKQTKKISFILLTCFLAACTGFSQDRNSHGVPWVSDKGYWVAEGNIKDPLTHTIYFYDNNDQLIHTEHLTGMKLYFDKRKTKMKMKKALEQTLELYSQHHDPGEISDFLAAYLK